jgi:hypothetical protein
VRRRIGGIVVLAFWMYEFEEGKCVFFCWLCRSLDF